MDHVVIRYVKGMFRIIQYFSRLYMILYGPQITRTKYTHNQQISYRQQENKPYYSL